MNEILAKISTYDIFNNLVPGAVVAYLLAVLDVYKIDAGSLVTDLVVFYFIGLVVSRIGSLVLEPLLKLIRFVRYAEYPKFIEASRADAKVLLLLEVNNQYRTMLAALLVTAAGYYTKDLAQAYQLTPATIKGSLLIFLCALFLMAYRKQTTYIRRRVEHHAEKAVPVAEK
jgi:hypothetical protein